MVRWLTPEPVFDYGIIKNIICKKIMRLSNVTVLKNAKVKNIKINNDIKSIILENNKVFFADYLINATYSNIPAISNLISDVKIDGKYELCIMPNSKNKYSIKKSIWDNNNGWVFLLNNAKRVQSKRVDIISCR